MVTWRLADSMPATVLTQLKHERDTWIRTHPKPWDTKTAEEFRRHFSERNDLWLDQGHGSCLLRNKEIATVVTEAILHFDGQRHDIDSFVVMPNHVHVLFPLLPPHRLEDVVKSWKGYSAREINRRTRQGGPLWQEDYWDRLIRDEDHFLRCRDYILENPAKAKLRDGEFVLFSKNNTG